MSNEIANPLWKQVSFFLFGLIVALAAIGFVINKQTKLQATGLITALIVAAITVSLFALKMKRHQARTMPQSHKELSPPVLVSFGVVIALILLMFYAGVKDYSRHKDRTMFGRVENSNQPTVYELPE